jgi:hypothetical protein
MSTPPVRTVVRRNPDVSVASLLVVDELSIFALGDLLLV